MDETDSFDLFEESDVIVGDPSNSPYYDVEFEEAYKRSDPTKITWQQLHDNSIYNSPQPES